MSKDTLDLKIIKRMEKGWTYLKFINATVKASYITDVSDDLLHMCEEYISRQTAIFYFDEEGTSGTLVLNPDTAYIIHESDYTNLVKLEESPMYIIKNILKDIENLYNHHKFCENILDYYEQPIQEQTKIYANYYNRINECLKNI